MRLNVTFVGEGGMGNLVWVRIFFSNLSFFFLTYNSVRIFFSIISVIFFSVQGIFSSYILASLFPSKSVCRIFFLNSPITPSKVKWSAPKIRQTFAQLADSDLSIISKAFWNNMRQNSLGDREGIHFYLPLPRESVQTDICMVTS